MKGHAKQKLPAALIHADAAYSTFVSQVDAVLIEMARWGIVRDAVLDWANSMTTTNCGWSEYGLAQAIIARWRQRERESVR